MHFRLIKSLKGIELQKERLKSFKIVVLVEVILILLALLLPETLKMFKVEAYVLISELIFPTVAMVLIILWWDMLRIYTSSKVLIISLLVVMVVFFLSNIVLLNPFDPLLTGSAHDVYSTFLMLFILLLEVILIRITIVEIFRNDLSLNENLWGAVFIYLTTGAAFASIYTIIFVLDPTQIAIGMPKSPISYQKMMAYSFTVLGGLDNPYDTLSHLVLNISTVEAIMGNLFIVFVVGRLFTRVSHA